MNILSYFTEIIENAGNLMSTAITASVFFATFVPPVRNFVINWLKRNLDINKINKELETQNKSSKKREDMVLDVKEKLEKHIEEYKKHTNGSKEIDIFFLRTEIDNIYRKYIPLGYITTKAKSDLAKAFELYKALGGNTYAEEEVNELFSLPVRF